MTVARIPAQGMRATVVWIPAVKSSHYQGRRYHCEKRVCESSAEVSDTRLNCLITSIGDPLPARGILPLWSVRAERGALALHGLPGCPEEATRMLAAPWR